MKALACLRRTALPVALGAAALVICQSARADEAVAPSLEQASVVVDFSAPQGQLLRTERYNNVTGANLYAAQLKPDVDFMNAQGLHGAVYRVWVNDGGYDPATGGFDASPYAEYLTQVSRLSDSILVNLQPGAMVRAGRSPAEIKAAVKTILLTLKRSYPAIEYIEAFNEPDHSFAKLMKPEDLYKYYVSFYEAVNEVNGELHPKRPLKVGGPALMEFDKPWLAAFLDGYKADPSPSKRLDFISYHGYGHFEIGSAGGMRPYHFYKGDPSEVAGQRDELDAELKARGLNPDIPSFLTEIGIYPGPSNDNPTDPRPDYLRQAAGVTSLVYWYMQNPKNRPFNWVLRHQTEERKDELVTRAPQGRPIPTGKFTPYGNALLMLSKMKDTRVSAHSDALREGKGVYVLGSYDSSGAAVLVWNYQSTQNVRYQVKLDLTRLPARLRNRQLRERLYRVDQTTSNFTADLDHANLQQVQDKQIKAGAAYQDVLDLEPNALELVVIEPKGEAAPAQRRP